jgi:adenylyl- and sulfurtransferase ThiI
MCKKPTFPMKDSQLVNLPVFKPLSAFESKHYIKKMAQRIKQTLDSIDFDEMLAFENLDPELSSPPSPLPEQQI